LLNMMQQKMALKEFQKETIKENDKLYFWFTHSLVRKELPMLFKGDESIEAISKKVRRIAKELEDTGLIECHKSAKSLKKSMYCFTDLSDSLETVSSELQLDKANDITNFFVTGVVYILEDRGYFKIGFTKNLDARISQHKTSSPTIMLIESFNGSKADEYFLHKKYAHKNYIREWFTLSDQDVQDIKKYFLNK
jgi:T5orf172 domain